MASTIYDISINAITGVAPSDGFIDPKPAELYFNESTVGFSLDESMAKERGNIRFKWLVEQLQLLGNADLVAIETPGAAIDTAPTSISFRVIFEHGDPHLRVADEENPGEFLTGIDAVKRAAARALMISYTQNARDIYNPEPTKAGSTVPHGMTVIPITIGALTEILTEAESAITVTKIV